MSVIPFFPMPLEVLKENLMGNVYLISINNLLYKCNICNSASLVNDKIAVGTGAIISQSSSRYVRVLTSYNSSGSDVILFSVIIRLYELH